VRVREHSDEGEEYSDVLVRLKRVVEDYDAADHRGAEFEMAEEVVGNGTGVADDPVDREVDQKRGRCRKTNE